MRAIVIYLAVAALAALAAYIIRSNNKLISNALLIVSAISLCILFISIIIEQ
ncbi:MAG: hypothetical protein AAGB35_01810 [Pseudomonadota bacterium]